LKLSWEDNDNNIDWHEASTLYKIAPMGDKRPQDIKQAFGNSLYKCFVFDQAQLVGIGRALADGIDCSYLCDIAVHPDYQGHGIGKGIIENLTELSKGHKKIILYAVPGKEAFYKKFGFKRMSTAMAIFKDHDNAINTGLINET